MWFDAQLSLITIYNCSEILAYGLLRSMYTDYYIFI